MLGELTKCDVAEGQKGGLGGILAINFNKTYVQRVYAAAFEPSNLYAVESHDQRICWQLGQETNSLVFGCLGPEAPWASFSPSAAELEALAEERGLAARKEHLFAATGGSVADVYGFENRTAETEGSMTRVAEAEDSSSDESKE